MNRIERKAENLNLKFYLHLNLHYFFTAKTLVCANLFFQAEILKPAWYLMNEKCTCKFKFKCKFKFAVEQGRV